MDLSATAVVELIREKKAVKVVVEMRAES